MNSRFNVALAVVAGLIGGALSQHVPLSVHAQAPPVPSKELRAQSFVFVNPQGVTIGTLFLDEPRPGTSRLDDPRLGTSRIRLIDPSGNEIWSAGGSPIRPLAVK
jgi:hypothetical protein